MEELKVRRATVAGQFYPSTRQELSRQIESLINKKAKKQDVIACMLPHAGYVYSGRVAAETLSRVNLKERIILLGPNHTGMGAAFSVMAEGSWQTPLGEVKIDTQLAKALLGRCRYLEENSLAHIHEHSLEVELPFLQYFKSDFKIVPITLLSDTIRALKETGKEIASAIQDNAFTGSTLLVASSDMTHYESQAQAEKKDRRAIEAILELNEDLLAERIQELSISMCGWAPTMVMLSAAKALGAKKGELVRYQTSGDVTGDTSSVVGYAGIIAY
ncbi:MAG: AmmeMemoRadiSam system protein B [Candidatus Omnitrophota bacterium]|jgi:hypothetical protein